MSSVKNSVLSVLETLPQTNKIRGISAAIRKADISEEQAARVFVSLQSCLLDGHINARQHRLRREMRALEGLKSREAREKDASVKDIIAALEGMDF